MDQFLSTYSPRCRVTVRDLATGKARPIGPRLDGDITDDVLTLTTAKAYGRAAGTFQIVLAYRIMPNGQTYANAIIPDDIVSIELDAGDGNGMQMAMLGLVDRPARSFTAVDGIPQRSVKLSGQDLGKLLQRHRIGWDIAGAQVQIPGQGESPVTRIMNSYMRRVPLQVKTPPDLCEVLLTMALDDMSKISPTIRFNDQSADDWILWDDSMAFIRDTTAWDAMKRAEHDPVNTLTTETTGPNSFEVRLEPTPIGNDGKLATAIEHTIQDVDIVMEDVGVCDAERINLLCYWPTIYQLAVSGQVDIVMANPDLTQFDQDSIRQHGYCVKIIQDDFNTPDVKTGLDKNAEQKVAALAIPKAKMFWEWYRRNHELESGTYTVHLSPQIRAGHGLLVKQRSGAAMEYLIEQVTHQCTFAGTPQFITSLQVTRGQKR